MIKHILQIPPEFKNKENIILRDYLALERTKLANERTLMSYIRSSLYLVLGGIAFIQLQDFGNIAWVGYVALFLSVAFVLIGMWRYNYLNRQLSRFYVAEKTELSLRHESVQQK